MRHVMGDVLASFVAVPTPRQRRIAWRHELDRRSSIGKKAMRVHQKMLRSRSMRNGAG